MARGKIQQKNAATGAVIVPPRVDIPALKGWGYSEGWVFFSKPPTALPAMIASCGYHRETSGAYDWHGLKRGTTEFAAIQYTLSGFGRLEHAGISRRAEPGTALLLVVPSEHRYYLPPESEGWEFLYLSLNGAELIRIWREIIARKGMLVELSPHSPPIELCADIFKKVATHQVRSPFQASSLAYGLAMALYEEVLRETAPIPAFIEKVLETMKNHLDKDLSMDELAKVSGYSRYHFFRIFKQWVGASPGEYLHKLRLEESARMLRATNLSIKEVAFKCGFNDYNYFCRSFGKFFSITAGQFRKSGMFAGSHHSIK